jgi:nucleoside-triphosphatase THEP1
VITGEPGGGKTTLLKKVINESKKDFYGILSERFDKGYYVEDVKTGEKRILCSEDCIGFKFRRFYFDPASLTFIEESLRRKGDILVYDEIGYLEVEEKIKIWEYIKEPAILIVRKDLIDYISARFSVDVFEVKKERELINMILKKIDG